MSALSTCFLWLITYSFGGWVFESAVCSLYERRPVNRGFLKGPVCPVYGFGALVCVAFLSRQTDRLFLIFFAGMALDCTVEYFTAVLLERLFHARWWDYSGHRFHFQGRICLSSAVAFGLLSVVLLRYIHPAVLRWTESVPDPVRIALALMIFVMLEADLSATLRRLLPPESSPAGVRMLLAPRAALAGFWKGSSDVPEALGEPLQSLFRFGRSRTKRMAGAFPRLKFTAWQKLKSILKGPGRG